jgi:2-polyprenyl-6-hydroxyphenyl methylase/3-demethylubiquinone-9 3-methyltransferase
MEWFERQAAAGLTGAIDHERSGNGTIVCRDGLRLSAVAPAEFSELIAGLDVGFETLEIDGSSRLYILQEPFRPRREPEGTAHASSSAL